MPGWSREKRRIFEESFCNFLGECHINSRDHGSICLGENLYDAQKIFFTAVFDGLEQDVHIFDCLKSRQLGISTSVRCLSLFWMGAHPGLHGACVFDTDGNKNNARAEIETIIRDLPASLEFPGIKTSNRMGLMLDNDSNILFMSAGVKKSKSSGTLGRSVGLSFAHLSELCSYENPEGLEAFNNSLSEINPNRLYLRESTARGFNSWHDVWSQDRDDPAHARCVFLGWWSKNSQVVRKSDPDFQRYGVPPPTEKELKKCREVRELYGHIITPEQLAWIRRKMDPGAKAEVGEAVEFEGDALRVQEQPWTESDSWQMTGAAFFAPENLKEVVDRYISKKYNAYIFSAGIEFTDMRIYPAPNRRMEELKIWEEPENGGAIYAIGCDPAYGSHEKNDRSAIQVLRCYADGCDQVAEYAFPLIGTKQLAWCLLAVASWYAGDNNEVHFNLELNGPGDAVWNELQFLRLHASSGYQPKDFDERGLRDCFRNIRNYLFTRPDAKHLAGLGYHSRTSPGQGVAGKVRLMERLRDAVSTLSLRIRSMDTLEEMRSIAREGDSISAQGVKKDDRVMAMALAVRCWEEGIRRTMTVQKRTREYEAARRVLSAGDRAAMFQKYQLESMFAVKRRGRHQQQIAMRRQMRGYR